MTRQPFVSSDENVVALYNGEIYNAASFTDVGSSSDGAALIPAYRSSGTSFASLMDGEFAVVLFDYSLGQVVLAADTFGTKPLFYSFLNETFIIASYRSAVERILQENDYPVDQIEQLAPNTVLVFPMLPPKDPSGPSLIASTPSSIMNTTNFNLTQYKTDTADFVSAFMSSVEKRSHGLQTTPFVGLSSGYDSGAIACALASIGRVTNAYTVNGIEDIPVVEQRLGRMEELGALGKNVTISMLHDAYDSEDANSDSSIYSSYQALLHTVVEPYSYPGDLGYKRSKDKELIKGSLDMRRDPGAVGLGAVCRQARADDAKVYFSGTGADEIISDYGFNGKKVREAGIREAGVDEAIESRVLLDFLKSNHFLSRLLLTVPLGVCSLRNLRPSSLGATSS